MQTMEQRITRWEDQRTLKNLMGKYAHCLILNRETDIFSQFWSKAEDVALGLNDGWYRGREAVGSYYAACRRRNELVAGMMQASFPKLLEGKTRKELYGTGPFRVVPVSAPIIEVAEDGETAKGLWASLGSCNDVEPCGPLARWVWGYFAADFVREGGQWKIWHLQYLKDIQAVCGESWGRPGAEHPPVEGFAALADFVWPPFTEERVNRRLYDPRRPHTPAPRIPAPYRSFSETFSYGE